MGALFKLMAQMCKMRFTNTLAGRDVRPRWAKAPRVENWRARSVGRDVRPQGVRKIA